MCEFLITPPAVTLHHHMASCLGSESALHQINTADTLFESPHLHSISLVYEYSLAYSGPAASLHTCTSTMAARSCVLLALCLVACASGALAVRTTARRGDIAYLESPKYTSGAATLKVSGPRAP